MFDECTCDCHIPGHFAMHIAPCCEVCSKCNKRIAIVKWSEHEKTCDTQVQLLHDEPPNDFEEMIISALEFYANSGEDNGELARETIKIVTTV